MGLELIWVNNHDHITSNDYYDYEEDGNNDDNYNDDNDESYDDDNDDSAAVLMTITIIMI